MSLLFSVPGKSFFIGEYLALNSGPCITVATMPRFELRVRPGAGWLNGIHKDSPAGELIKRYAVFFNQFDLDFIDPHLGRGGWGASTAQFLSCYALLEWQDATLFEAEKYLDTNKMIRIYKDLAWRGAGLPPSGADLVGQLKGGLNYFDKKRGQLAQLRWTFPELEFYLIPTGHKIATHEHLNSLKNFDSQKLESVTRSVVEAFQSAQPDQLVQGLQEYAKELEVRDWVHPRTLEYLVKLNSIPGVLATKGCGALGADVVLAIVEKNRATMFEALLKDEGKAYFSRHHLSPGLGLVVEGDMKIERHSIEIAP